MTLNLRGALLSSFVVFFLCSGCLTPSGFAQTNVEIELVGPWSYVQDPADPARVIVIAPQMGHIMAVFKGENAFDYSNDTEPSAGSHRLEFSTNTCSSAPSSSYYLYPLNGISAQTIRTALSSSSAYSLSLPKPCYYESNSESRFKYNGRHTVAGADSERSLTTWMILNYSVGDPTIPALLDKGTSTETKIEFGSNSGTNKKAISVILYVNVGIGPDTRCDSHSAAIFDSVLTMWTIPHVFRAFPKLKSLANSNQQLTSYDYSCNQMQFDSLNMFAIKSSVNQGLKAKRSHSAERHAMAPGRADCHAPQVNINGAVM